MPDDRPHWKGLDTPKIDENYLKIKPFVVARLLITKGNIKHMWNWLKRIFLTPEIVNGGYLARNELMKKVLLSKNG